MAPHTKTQLQPAFQIKADEIKAAPPLPLSLSPPLYPFLSLPSFSIKVEEPTCSLHVSMLI